MKTNKKILEEKVKEEIKENKEIINYYIAKFLKLPFPGILIPIGLPLLAILSAQVSRVFLIVLVAFIIYIINLAITSWEYFIIVFLASRSHSSRCCGELVTTTVNILR